VTRNGTVDETIAQARTERALADEALARHDLAGHRRHTATSLRTLLAAAGRPGDGSAAAAQAPDIDQVTLAMLASGADLRDELWIGSVRQAMALLISGHYTEALPWFDRALELRPEREGPELRYWRAYAETGLEQCILQGGQDRRAEMPPPTPLEPRNPFGAVFEDLFQAGALAQQGDHAAAAELLAGAQPRDDLTEHLFGDLIRGFRAEWEAVGRQDFARARAVARQLDEAVLRPGRLLAEMGAPAAGGNRMTHELRLWNLLRAGGYALQQGQHEEALIDFSRRARLEASEGDTGRPGWLSLLMMSFGHYGLDLPEAGCLLGKLAVAELQALRRRMAEIDVDLAEIRGTFAAQCYDVLGMALVRLGRHLEAREIAALRLGGEATARTGAVPPAPSLDPVETALAAELLEAAGHPEGQHRLADTLGKVATRLRAEADAGRVAFEAALAAAERQAWPEAAASDTLRLVFLPAAQHGPMTIMASGMGVEIERPARASFETASQLGFELVQAVVARRPEAEDLAVEAYRALFAPIAGDLPQAAARLVVTAPGPLHALPWAMLSDGRTRLVECFDLVRAAPPGVDQLRPPRRPLQLLACAAAEGGHGFPPLPNVQAEIRSLGASRILDGRQGFTRALLAEALPAASMLHIASHFRADAVDLARSVLLLGDGTFLTLRELLDLGLPGLDLVVLSACDSGVVAGRQSWSSAFAVDHLLIGSGVPAALGTLWPVADRATAALMSRFHAGLAFGLDKAAALGDAQRAFLRGEAGPEWREPWFWAGPVLSGNWLGCGERAP
jgi:CHAT domain-containing protein